MPPGIRRISFVRFMRDLEKARKSQYWILTGSDQSLLNIACSRLIKSLGCPAQRMSQNVDAISIFHTCGELDLMSDGSWTLILDDIKKIKNFDLFKEGIHDSLLGNYLVITGESVDEGVQKFFTDLDGKIVTCERPENRVDFLKIVEQIFRYSNIQLTEASLNALLSLTGYSTGAVVNAVSLLRNYYDPSGAVLELDYNDIKKVVPALNFEDVFSVITEVLYGNLANALDYYHKLTDRDTEIHFLFMDQMLKVLRSIWVFQRLGELGTEQQEDLLLDKRTYRKIRNQNFAIKDCSLTRMYLTGLGVLETLQSTSVKPSFIVEAYLIYTIRMLRGEEVGEFPTVVTE